MAVVTTLPRAPFMDHSRRLFEHLIQFASTAGGATRSGEVEHVLEVGCGPNSPLRPMVKAIWPHVRLHQIDVQAEVVEKARQHNPDGLVEQLRAADLSTIASDSKDFVIGMAVFDQNPDHALPPIGKELHRVLKPGGFVVYLHNEELNLPATAASLVYASFRPMTLHARPQLLIPSDRWAPPLDNEHCLGDMNDVQGVLQEMGEPAVPLISYLTALHPTPNELPSGSADGRRNALFLAQMNPTRMQIIREIVTQLRSQPGLDLEEIRTSELLKRRIAGMIFTKEQGFELLEADVFEIRQQRAWQDFLETAPSHKYFARGVSRFACASNEPIAPVAEFRQDLNEVTEPGEDDVVLIAHQFGLLARKRPA